MNVYKKIVTTLCFSLFGAEDELIFQTARWIVIAEYQNIIFNEFIPLVIGNDAMKEYRLFTNISTEYNETINPTIHNGFQTAAARFGHSMVQVTDRFISASTSIFHISE